MIGIGCGVGGGAALGLFVTEKTFRIFGGYENVAGPMFAGPFSVVVGLNAFCFGAPPAHIFGVLASELLFFRRPYAKRHLTRLFFKRSKY